MVTDLQLPTVCEEARCPNLSECWSSGTATFLLMGEVCTRGCRFCSVKTAQKGESLDPLEPQKILDTVRAMGLTYVVLTSVDRDDLANGGAPHFAKVVAELKQGIPAILVETLMPDFNAEREALAILAGSGADVLAHNLETVRSLTPRVRDPRSDYDTSLAVLRELKELSPGTLTKSSIMLGLGESREELEEALSDLREVQVDLLTLGQYLQPSPRHLEVVEFVKPETFEELQTLALQFGFRHVAAGPFVRSSYKAGELFVESLLRG
jgi:lipoic acid synthetase